MISVLVAVPLNLLGAVTANMFFSKPTTEQAVALAAVFQACELVADLAHTGDAPVAALELGMSSLLNQQPDSIDQLYGPLANLKLGIVSMNALFGENGRAMEQRPEVVRYVVSILFLARKLSKDKDRLNHIAEGIEQAARQAQHFSTTHDNVYSNIAALYEQWVSTLSVRIQVAGSAAYLRQPAIARRIRCQLFAAIRSAFLWQQLGGAQFHIVLRRKALARALPQL